jgi:acyl-CoA reductase-like NAD-dependent aldehyde dehydrogenase
VAAVPPCLASLNSNSIWIDLQYLLCSGSIPKLQLFDSLVLLFLDELGIGDPALLSTEIGPVINAKAKTAMEEYVNRVGLEPNLLLAVS